MCDQFVTLSGAVAAFEAVTCWQNHKLKQIKRENMEIKEMFTQISITMA